MYNKYRGVTLTELIITMIIGVILLLITSLTFLEMIYHYGNLSDIKYSEAIAQECAEKISGYRWMNDAISTSVCSGMQGIFTISVTSGDWVGGGNDFKKITVTVTGGTRWPSSRNISFLLPKS